MSMGDASRRSANPQIGVFISYAHEDKAVAGEIASSISAHGYRVWIDEGELRAGDSLVRRVAEAVQDLEFVLALISPASADSHWCRLELAMAVTDGLAEGRVKVLPVRLGRVELPPELRHAFARRLEAGHVEALANALVADMESHTIERQSGRSGPWRTWPRLEPTGRRLRGHPWRPWDPLEELEHLTTEPSARRSPPFLGPWPDAIRWYPAPPELGVRLDGIREGWLRQYLGELTSGRWGDVVQIWFDDPSADGIGDRPWEPCAITRRGSGRYAVVTEDYTTKPRRLRQYSEHDAYDEALETARRLRPWQLG